MATAEAQPYVDPRRLGEPPPMAQQIAGLGQPTPVKPAPSPISKQPKPITPAPVISTAPSQLAPNLDTEKMVNDPVLMAQQLEKETDPAKIRTLQARIGLAKSDYAAQTKQLEADKKLEIQQNDSKYRRELAEEQKKNISDVQAKMQEESAFVPTKESAKDIAGLFALMSVAAFGSGGKGKYSGMQALASLTGAMKGYQAGQKDVYDKEIKNFEENLKATRQHNETLLKKIELMRDTYAINKDEAEAMKQDAIAFAADGLAARALRSGRFDLAENIAQSALASATEVQKNAKKLIDEKALIQARAASQLDTFKKEEKLKQPDIFQAPDGTFVAWDGEKQAYLPVKGAIQGMTKVGATGGGKGSMNAQAFKQQQSRFLNSISEGASALESLGRMSVKTTGKLYEQDKTLNGLFTSPLKALDSKLSSEDSQILSQRMAGIAQNLASVETLGAATGLAGLRTGLESRLKIPPNASVAVALNALGDMRQIIESAVDAQSRDPNVLPEIKAANKQYMDRIRKAIPFTLEDLDKARAASTGALKIPKEDQKMSFTEFAKRYGEGKSETQAAPSNKPKANPDEEIHEDANGNRAVMRNGKWVEVQ